MDGVEMERVMSAIRVKTIQRLLPPDLRGFEGVQPRILHSRRLEDTFLIEGDGDDAIGQVQEMEKVAWPFYLQGVVKEMI